MSKYNLDFHACPQPTVTHQYTHRFIGPELKTVLCSEVRTRAPEVVGLRPPLVAGPGGPSLLSPTAAATLYPASAIVSASWRARLALARGSRAPRGACHRGHPSPEFYGMS